MSHADPHALASPCRGAAIAARVALLCAVGGAAAGCGPSLRFVDPNPDGLAVDGTCSQGPFVIERASLGGRWGESLEVQVFAPRPVVARYELSLAGAVIARGAFRTVHAEAAADGASRLVADADPDNRRCLERPVVAPEPQVAATAAAPPADGPPVTAPPVDAPSVAVPPAAAPPAAGPPVGWAPAPPRLPEGPPAGWEPPAVPVPAVAQPAAPAAHAAPEAPAAPQRVGPASLVVVAARMVSGHHHGHVVAWRREVHDLGGRGVEAGLPLLLQIWSEQPLDWSGVRFRVDQAAAKPSVTEVEWLAHLREKEREREKERREAAAAAAVRRRAWELEWRKDQERRHRRAEFCRTHLDDEGCWGKGGWPALQARQRDRAEQARREAERAAARPAPALPAAAPDAAPPQSPPAPRVCRPDGPPPEALTEELPPRPTAQSDWVVGYWAFGCEGWFWLGGWWKVPEPAAGEEAEVTVDARVAPPPLQVEAPPPCPVVGAIWIAGSWSWGGGRWVWVVGRWALPPTMGVVWRPTAWIAAPLGVRMRPGRWVQPRR